MEGIRVSVVELPIKEQGNDFANESIVDRTENDYQISGNKVGPTEREEQALLQANTSQQFMQTKTAFDEDYKTGEIKKDIIDNQSVD